MQLDLDKSSCDLSWWNGRELAYKVKKKNKWGVAMYELNKYIFISKLNIQTRNKGTALWEQNANCG